MHIHYWKIIFWPCLSLSYSLEWKLPTQSFCSTNLKSSQHRSHAFSCFRLPSADLVYFLYTPTLNETHAQLLEETNFTINYFIYCFKSVTCFLHIYTRTFITGCCTEILTHFVPHSTKTIAPPPTPAQKFSKSPG